MRDCTHSIAPASRAHAIVHSLTRSLCDVAHTPCAQPAAGGGGAGAFGKPATTKFGAAVRSAAAFHGPHALAEMHTASFPLTLTLVAPLFPLSFRAAPRVRRRAALIRVRVRPARGGARMSKDASPAVSARKQTSSHADAHGNNLALSFFFSRHAAARPATPALARPPRRLQNMSPRSAPGLAAAAAAREKPPRRLRLRQRCAPRRWRVPSITHNAPCCGVCASHASCVCACLLRLPRSCLALARPRLLRLLSALRRQAPSPPSAHRRCAALQRRASTHTRAARVHAVLG
jgi:hypothetical protein